MTIPRRPDFERIRVLIWAKTYPELSTHHTETVCTGGCRENGEPIRLYPVPLRYLAGEHRYNLYDVIEVDVQPDTKDGRPESHRIDTNSVRVVQRVQTDRSEWAERRGWIFRNPSWHFASVDELKSAREKTGLSMGVVQPGEIVSARVVQKPAAERAEYAAKWEKVTAAGQGDLFPREYKQLEYIPVEIRLAWRCTGACACRTGNPHDMQILDWGLIELGRKSADWEQSRRRLEDLADLQRYDFRVFMGNFKAHPQNFGVIGLWYPQRSDQTVLL